MTLRPYSLREANRLITQWHSHHKPVRGCKFVISAWSDSDLVGIVIVGRPLAAALQDGFTFEVTRLCTNGHPHAASKLLGAAWRAARAMGVRRLISYTRADELGTCYRAASWRATTLVRGDGWNHGNQGDRWLPGLYEPTTEIVDRVRWEIAA